MAALVPPVRAAIRRGGIVEVALDPGSRVRVSRLASERLVLDITLTQPHEPPPTRPAAGGDAAPDPTGLEQLQASQPEAAIKPNEAAASAVEVTPLASRREPAAQTAVADTVDELSGLGRSASRPVMGKDRGAGASTSREPAKPAAPGVAPAEGPGRLPLSTDDEPSSHIEQLVSPGASLVGLGSGRAAISCRWRAAGSPRSRGRLEESTGRYRLALARCLLGRGLGAEALATLDGGVPAGPLWRGREASGAGSPRGGGRSPRPNGGGRRAARLLAKPRGCRVEALARPRRLRRRR